MVIALDYDGTATADLPLWIHFVRMAASRRHQVYCVTMRTPEEAEEIDPLLLTEVSQLICTSRKAKKPYVESLGIKVNIWIDDNPVWILYDAAS